MAQNRPGPFLLAPCVQSRLPVNYAAVDTLDIALRLGTAALVGAVLGLNRELHGKPTGVRTLGLVCLGSALAVLSIHEGSITDASRIIQGIMTGVGFLGAGVIVRNSKDHHVHGLTTAACWFLAGPSRKQSTGVGRARDQPTPGRRRPQACCRKTRHGQGCTARHEPGSLSAHTRLDRLAYRRRT